MTLNKVKKDFFFANDDVHSTIYTSNYNQNLYLYFAKFAILGFGRHQGKGPYFDQNCKKLHVMTSSLKEDRDRQ